jgi:inosose dehydratase
MTDLSLLRLGTAPDSWGVWFPADDHQVTWQQYLDELPKAGYVWTELGPFGFLPNEPGRLRQELDQRGLRLCGGTMFAALHHGADALKKSTEEFRQLARVLVALDAKYLVHLPEQYTDLHTGAATDAADLGAEHWNNLIHGTNELGRIVSEEFGVELVFHPHVDTHVDTQERIERFLNDTDPQFVNLCLDTGHVAYAGGNNLEIVQRYPDRITYVHLKQVDPTVREHVRQANLPLSEAVKLGAMVEPPHGEPEMPPLLDALAGLGREIFCVIEQDLYPVAPDVPLPIAARTAGYFVACGLGPVRHWPYQPVLASAKGNTP